MKLENKTIGKDFLDAISSSKEFHINNPCVLIEYKRMLHSNLILCSLVGILVLWWFIWLLFMLLQN